MFIGAKSPGCVYSPFRLASARAPWGKARQKPGALGRTWFSPQLAQSYRGPKGIKPTPYQLSRLPRLSSLPSSSSLAVTLLCNVVFHLKLWIPLRALSIEKQFRLRQRREFVKFPILNMMWRSACIAYSLIRCLRNHHVSGGEEERYIR
jgi:hypothetical protein